MRQLSDTKHYKELPNDPTTLHCELIKNTIKKFKNDGLLEDKLAEGLNVVETQTPHFYLFPKIHKKNNPCRPVIISIDCHTSKNFHICGLPPAIIGQILYFLCQRHN